MSSEACKSHRCDDCPVCQRGRCCRRDNPDYQLPAEGDYQPFVGELGRLSDDGNRVECHVCGAYFDKLGTHAWAKHDITPAEYRALFGLLARTSLAGPRYQEWAATSQGAANLATSRALGLGIEAVRALTPEQRSQNAGRAGMSARRRQHPWRTSQSSSRSCTNCGRSFELPRGVSPRATCSKSCADARKGSNAPRKISVAQTAAIVARYTGARGEQAALGREFGVSVSRVQQLVRGPQR